MAKFGLPDIEATLEGHGGNPVVVRYMKRIFNSLRSYRVPDKQKLTLWNDVVQCKIVVWFL